MNVFPIFVAINVHQFYKGKVFPKDFLGIVLTSLPMIGWLVVLGLTVL